MTDLKMPDGQLLRFPDGTPDDVLDKAAKEYIGGMPSFTTGLRSVMEKGATLGLRDEIAGLAGMAAQPIRSLFGMSSVSGEEAYSRAVKEKRAPVESFEQSYPVLSTVAELGAGMGATLPSKGVQMFNKLSPLWQRAGQGATMGGTVGTIAGAGTAEDTFGKRVEGALTGGTIGALTGGAVPLAFEGLTRMGKHIGGVMGWRNPENVIMQKTIAAFERDGVTPEQAIAKLKNWEMQGSKPEMLFELGGENVKGLARAVAGVPGQGKNVAVERLSARQEGQSARIGQDITESVGGGKPGNYYGSVEGLQKARQTQAAPLYDEAFNTTGAVHNDRIAEFIKDPIVRQGIRKGLEVQRLEALAAGKKFDPSDYAVTGFNDAGDPILGKVPNLRLLDAAKRGMDEIIEGYRDPTSGRLNLDQRGRAIDQVRKSFVSEIDDTLGGAGNVYQQARQAWSGPSQSLDALRAGRSVLTKDPELTAAQVGKLSNSDKEFFRAGVMRALKDAVDKAPDGADAAKRIFGNQAIRDRLKATFDNANDWMKFESLMKRELVMFKNSFDVSPKSGSQTQMRQAEVSDLTDSPMMGFATDIAQGRGVVNSLLNATLGPKAMANLSQMTPRTRATGANMMFTPDYPTAEQNLLSLIMSRDKSQATQQRISELLRQLSVPAGLPPVRR